MSELTSAERRLKALLSVLRETTSAIEQELETRAEDEELDDAEMDSLLSELAGEE